MSDWAVYLLWFIIFAVIAWLVLYSLKPQFVLKGDGSGEVDFGKVLLWSVVIGLIGIFICWLVRRSGY
jgi:H+/Cl- antiporter ClcA